MDDYKDINNKSKKRNDYHPIIITLLASTIFIIFAYLFFLPHHTLKAAESNKTDIANAMMIELNAINNILTWGSFIVATLTIIAAVFGIVGFVELKKSVNKDIEKLEEITTKYTTIINSFFEDTNKAIEVFKNSTNNRVLTIESFKDSMVAQARFFNKSIDFLINVSSILTEKVDDKELCDMLFHDFYINTLYRSDFELDSNELKAILHYKKAALEFLKDKGTLDDIKDLETIAKNESNEDIKHKVLELIGIIKHKFAI